MIDWIYMFGWLQLLFCALFAGLYLLYLIRTKKLGTYFNTKANRIWIKFSLRILAFGLLIIALLGPVLGEDRKTVETTGKEIFLVVDLSRSMDATDVSPSRLSRAKYAAMELLKAFPTDRIGLIVFSGEAFVHCPLTIDHSALTLYVNTLATSLMPTATTNISAALELAMRKLQSDSKKGKTATAKAIVLLTDGENFTESVSETAARLKKNDVHFFTLGIGTESGGRIPTREGFLKDEEGNTAITTLKRDDLLSMAKNAGGRYFEASTSIDQSTALVSALIELKGAVQTTQVVDLSANKYLYPLLLALLLLTADVLITLTVIKV